MNRSMKSFFVRATAVLLVLSTGFLGLSAQDAKTDTDTLPMRPLLADRAMPQPQIAFRILDDYVTDKTLNTRKDWDTSGIINCIIGGLLLGGAAFTGFAGSDIIHWDSPDNRIIATAVLGGSGALMSGIGIGFLASTVPDFKAEYRMVYEEKDDVVQEAMSVAVLEDISQKAYEGRMAGALTSIGIPLVVAGLNVYGNLNDGKEWYVDLDRNMIIYVPSLIGGICSLLFQSDDELLIEKYRSARQALYSSPLSGDPAPAAPDTQVSTATDTQKRLHELVSEN